jgi:Domain of unknown function (DUF1963)
VLSPTEVAELAREEGLEAFADELAGYARPGWRLLPGGEDRPGASKVGGDPDLAEDESWPLNRRGVPMAFVAQIDASRLPAFDSPWELATPWRHDGQLIRLFADLLDSPAEPGLAVALMTDPAGPLTRTPAPPLPDPYPRGGRWDDYEPRDYLYRLPETIVRVRPFLTAPEMHPGLHPEMHVYGDNPDADRYCEWAGRLRVDGKTDWPPFPYEVQHVLGEPSSIQDDVRLTGVMFNDPDGYWTAVACRPPDPALTSEDAWAVLLGLHMDEAFGLDIHDGGAIQILAPVNDLAEGRLDRLLYSIDSG